MGVVIINSSLLFERWMFIPMQKWHAGGDIHRWRRMFLHRLLLLTFLTLKHLYGLPCTQTVSFAICHNDSAHWYPPFVLQGETDSAVLIFYLATTQDNESLIIYSRISLQWRYNYLFNSRRRRLYFTVGLLRIYSYCE